MRTLISEVLARKGNHVITAELDDTVYEAITRMSANKVGSVLVVLGNQVCGVFTERDYLRRVVLHGRTSKTTRVEEVMQRSVVFVHPRRTIMEAMDMMTKARCRHMPVVQDGKLVGLVSMGDCVKRLIETQREKVRHLRAYISGAYPA